MKTYIYNLNNKDKDPAVQMLLDEFASMAEVKDGTSIFFMTEEDKIKDLENRIRVELIEMPSASVILLGLEEYCTLRTSMTETMHGLSYPIDEYRLEVQWSHLKKNDLRVLAQID